MTTQEQAFAHPRVAADALLSDDAGRVLLVRPTYKDHWDIPGGYIEPGESPRAACVREVEEELGLVLHDLRILITDWAPNGGERGKILFVFDGGTPSSKHLASITVAAAEIAEWRFVAPPEFGDYLTDRLVRRLTTAINARDSGSAAYAEHGVGA